MTRSALVVATRNREADLAELLRLLGDGRSLPHEILVVDASDDPGPSADTCRRLAPRLATTVRHVVAEKAGLASQRNQALRLTAADVVHFLDDDSRPEETYFERLEEFLAAAGHEHIGAVTGLVTNHARPRRSSPLHRLLMLDPSPGQLNRAGRNAVIRSAEAPFAVRCLSGCTMTFRRQALAGCDFDETLQRGLTGGYALGEDLDMSLQVGQQWELWCVPSARLRHDESPSQRADRLQYAHASAAFRRRLAEDPDSPVDRWRFWWSTMGEAALAGANYLLRRDPDGLAAARAMVRGARDRRVLKEVESR